MTEQELLLIIDTHGFDIDAWPNDLATQAKQSQDFKQILENCNKINSRLLEPNIAPTQIELNALKQRILTLAFEDEVQPKFITTLIEYWQQLIMGGAVCATSCTILALLILPNSPASKPEQTGIESSQITITLKRNDELNWLQEISPKSNLERILL